jgi:16S rRNA (adenine1518-N6/adenine1519-N6)-dimethyltransferase
VSAPNKRLGQHFLTDSRLLARIADALEPAPDDVVIEIGPGKGSLTRELLARGSRVIAIEKDRRLAEECGVWSAESAADRLKLVVGDALRLNWHALLDTHAGTPHSAFSTPHVKIVGNIPYNITSPLIERALLPPLPERIVFLVQREVAERVVARPGGKVYGALSIGVQACCRVELLFRVPAGAFRPPPKVESALLRLTPLDQPLVGPEEGAAFRRFVTACFSRRRKQLRNVIAGVTGRPVAAVAAGLEGLGLDPSARPETLAPAEFVRLLRWSM